MNELIRQIKAELITVETRQCAASRWMSFTRGVDICDRHGCCPLTAYGKTEDEAVEKLKALAMEKAK